MKQRQKSVSRLEETERSRKDKKRAYTTMSNQMMQAIRVHQYGGPEQLKLEQIPCPEPQPGEMFIRVHATGVLPVEWKIRQGAFHAFQPATFPYIPGSAFAGVIEEVGDGVTAFQKGQAVFGRSNKGTYAEYTTASEDTVAVKPASLSFDEAATISGGATVAWEALFDRGELQAGQRVLILGAAGGVGSFAVQFAKWKGAQVIGTTGTANVDFVRSLGAETVVNYTTTPVEQVVHDVDLVVDTVGGQTLESAWPVIKRGGTLVSIAGQPSQEKAHELGIRALFFSGGRTSSERLQTIAQLIDGGYAKATLARIFPLREASLAHELSQSRHGRGRIVLRIAD
jgi:NADPH:quinone reductase-like Zn-dependent oxidoreductase